MTAIESAYAEKCRNPKWNDMVPRMADLREYGTKVKTVTEFGLREGNSTIAFLAGGASVTSYDLDLSKFGPPEGARWKGISADTTQLADIEETDLLFIDSLHTRRQVAAELTHHKRVRQFILLHDPIQWGAQGEHDQEGILYAVLDFLRAQKDWQIRELLIDRWGLLVLERLR